MMHRDHVAGLDKGPLQGRLPVGRAFSRPLPAGAFPRRRRQSGVAGQVLRTRKSPNVSDLQRLQKRSHPIPLMGDSNRSPVLTLLVQCDEPGEFLVRITSEKLFHTAAAPFKLRGLHALYDKPRCSAFIGSHQRRRLLLVHQEHGHIVERVAGDRDGSDCHALPDPFERS